jgi:hypothetical protein
LSNLDIGLRKPAVMRVCGHAESDFRMSVFMDITGGFKSKRGIEPLQSEE